MEEDCLNKVHLGEIKAQTTGMGEKMLEGKTAAGQTRAAMGYSRKTQAPCLLHLASPIGSCRNSIHQPTKKKQVLTITIPTERRGAVYAKIT